MSKCIKPEFSSSLLHPKYWVVWFSFGVLALLVNVLPYRILYFLGRVLGRACMKLAKNRCHIAKRNLELAFPDKSPDEIQQLIGENFKNTGLALIETGIAWFWPTWRFKQLLISDDMSEVTTFEKEIKGVLFCCTHMLNLEITGRAFAVLGVGGYGVYRAHTNLAYEFIQCWGRSHNGNQMIERNNLKGVIRILKNGGRVWYLPDHDYGRDNSVFVPFFAVKDACTTTGTSFLVNISRCAIVFGSGIRQKKGKYYIKLEPSIHNAFPKRDPKAAATFMNEQIENIILKAPEQWMWLHKRFKTMEDTSVPRGIRYQ